jgi:DNA polymerase-3 subunit alpha
MEVFSKGSTRTNVPAFTHLKVYSSYSIGVGLNTPAEICAFAARLGYPSVALTDVGGTYGFVEFHRAARQHGVKPIYGAAVDHYAVGMRGEERHALTLVAATREGLRHVAALASLCATGAETGTALDIEVLGANAAGVVAFMGAQRSEIAKLLSVQDEDGAGRVVGIFKDIFGDRLFIEVQDHGGADERALAGRLVRLAAKTETAPLLTHGVRYVEKGIRELYGALRGIRDSGEARDFFRIDREPRDWSMKSPLEMGQLRPFYEAAFDNTSQVEEMVEGDLMCRLGEQWPEGQGMEPEALRREVLERCAPALRERLARGTSSDALPYREILEREVDEAIAEGIGPTLLFFHRALSHLRDARVDLGPATGLSLQSLCASLLGITCFDP